ncbi:harpin-induced protein [Iris pallida]|uniref:Harpin-induced protein n=1 Tax=Iris pallida TaxID=29817 RepID=A0AAX6ILD9_IRIPA|nr:harpin-induced protein [Iris pallida]
MANQISPMEQELHESKVGNPTSFNMVSAAESKQQEIRPLTFPSPSLPPPVADEEAGRRWTSSQYLRKRRVLLCCGGCCGATVLLLGFLLLILSFTVLKVRDPVLTMNSISIDNVNLGLGTWSHPLSINATLTADISLKNPNVAAFSYDGSATEFRYYGQTVGVAYAPGGRVGADRTVRMNATLDVMVDRIGSTNATANVADGRKLNLTSYTDISGRVNVAGVYKRDLDVVLNCTMTLDLNSQTQLVQDQHCVADVR